MIFAKLVGILLAVPFMPLAYAVALLRAMARGPAKPEKPHQEGDQVSLAMQALALLQSERAARGLDPLECHGIEILYGDFDRVEIVIRGQTLAEGAAEGLSKLGAMGNFQVIPKIERTMELAQARSRMQAHKAGMSN